MELVLECNSETVDKTPVIPMGSGEDYWKFRVKVSKNQAVIGFPKFFTIGIGFAKEKDWNTNLPYTSDTEKIWNHIKHNKGRGPKDEDCIRAIQMIQEAVKASGV